MGDLIVRGGVIRPSTARPAPLPSSMNGWRRCDRPASQKIDGRIIGDDQRFDDEGIGPGWAWDYLQFAIRPGQARCSSTRISRPDDPPSRPASQLR